VNIRTFVVAILMACFGTGCANHLPPNATPVMRVAAYGGDVVSTVNLIARTTSTLPLSDDQKAPVMISANKIQGLGVKLADALEAYDRASAANKVGQADTIISLANEIDAVIDSLKFPSDSAAAQLGNLVVQLVRSIGKIKTALAAAGNFQPTLATP